MAAELLVVVGPTSAPGEFTLLPLELELRKMKMRRIARSGTQEVHREGGKGG